MPVPLFDADGTAEGLQSRSEERQRIAIFASHAQTQVQALSAVVARGGDHSTDDLTSAHRGPDGREGHHRLQGELHLPAGDGHGGRASHPTGKGQRPRERSAGKCGCAQVDAPMARSIGLSGAEGL